MKLKMIGTMMVLMVAFLFCSNQASATSTMETAKEISLNTGVVGELKDDVEHDTEWYKFEIPKNIGNQSVFVNLISYMGYAEMSIYDDTLKQLTSWDDSQIEGRVKESDCSDSKIIYYEPGKTYFINVSNNAYMYDRTKFSVAISTVADDNWGSVQNAENLLLNTRYKRSLETKSDIDVYKVTFPNDGKKYIFKIEDNTGGDLQVNVLNSVGVPLTEQSVSTSFFSPERILSWTCSAETVYFVVSSNANNKGDYYLSSSPVVNTIKAPITNPYKTVVPKLRISKKNKKAVLKWNKKNGYKGCKIYRSTKKNGKYKCVKLISKKTSYMDKKVKKGKVYYYKVKIFTKQGTKIYYSRYSKVKKIKIK